MFRAGKPLFIGNALALTEEPRVVGTLRFTDFDGSPWIDAGRFPQASGSIALDARRAAFGLDGTLTSAALEAGPLRLQGAGEWLDSTLRIDSLRAWLPRLAASATVTGTVRFVEESAPELALAGEWSGLRWPLVDAAASRARMARSPSRARCPMRSTCAPRQAHRICPQRISRLQGWRIASRWCSIASTAN